MNKTIDFLMTGLDYGGAEFQVMHLLFALKNRGWKVRLITLMPPRAFVERFEAQGVPVISLGMTAKYFFPLAWIRLLKHVWGNNTKILHAHMVHANFMARFARYFSPIKALICSAHSIDEGGALREWVYKYTDFLSDITTNVSQAALDRYIQIGAISSQKARLMHNGIDIHYFRKMSCPPSENFVWVAVGRLEKQKNYALLLKAFAVLLQSQRAMLHIVGKGIQEKELKQLSMQLGIETHITFLGVRDDIPAILSKANAFVLASAWEGYGLVVAEAMACELPVVVTDSGGPGEIVGRDGKAGYVVSPQSADALAQSMLNMMQLSPEERMIMGRYGRARIVSTYALTDIVDGWEKLYTDTLSQNSAR